VTAELLEIKVLGGLEIRRAGTLVTLPPSRKTRALLAYLAMADRPVRRERLCELLWDIPDDPRGALRWSLSKIRTLLDDSATRRVIADREMVALDLHTVQVDIHVVRDALARGVEALSLTRLEELAGIFKGGFLEGLDLTNSPEFHAWILAQRQEADTLRKTVLTELVQRLADRPNEALPHARLLAELNPLDEEAQARVVRLLATAGRVRDAERQYKAAALILEAGQIPETGVLRDALNTLKNLLQTGPAADTAPPEDQALVQEIRFCTAADGTRIAYSIAGEGPPIVKTANWLNHLEYDWESPIWRHVAGSLRRTR
jgi:DNA-binding SARP family transcriptional activator